MLQEEKFKTIDVDGRQYMLMKYLGGKGLRVFQKLTKVLGKPLMALVSQLANKEGAQALQGLMSMDSNETLGAIGEALENVSASMDPDEFESFAKYMVEGIEEVVDGKRQKINFDVHFQGQILHFFKLMAENIGYQFSDVFQEVAGLKAKVPATFTKIKGL